VFNDTWVLPYNSTSWRRIQANAGFTARSHFSAAYNTTDQNIYIWGGSVNPTTPDYIDSVYKCPVSNLSAWTLVNGTPAFNGRLVPQGNNIFAGKLIVPGGVVTNLTEMHDVWYSNDGNTWTLVVANAAFSARHAAQLVNHTGTNPALYIIGGYGGADLNDAYKTTDLITWTSTTSSVWSGGGRPSHSALDFNGIIQVFFGGHTTTYYNDWLTSPDGITFTLMDSDPGWGPAGIGRRYSGMAVNATSMIMTAGNDGVSTTGSSNKQDTWVYISNLTTASA
jgi:hypothetical protein